MASPTSSERLKLLSITMPWGIEPRNALIVTGLYLLLAASTSAFKKASWRWMRPKSLVPSYCQ